MKTCTAIVSGCFLLIAVMGADCQPEKVAEHRHETLPSGPTVKGRLLYSSGRGADRIPVVL